MPKSIKISNNFEVKIGMAALVSAPILSITGLGAAAGMLYEGHHNNLEKAKAVGYQNCEKLAGKLGTNRQVSLSKLNQSQKKDCGLEIYSQSTPDNYSFGVPGGRVIVSEPVVQLPPDAELQAARDDALADAQRIDSLKPYEGMAVAWGVVLMGSAVIVTVKEVLNTEHPLGIARPSAVSVVNL